MNESLSAHQGEGSHVGRLGVGGAGGGVAVLINDKALDGVCRYANLHACTFTRVLSDESLKTRPEGSISV